MRPNGNSHRLRQMRTMPTAANARFAQVVQPYEGVLRCLANRLSKLQLAGHVPKERCRLVDGKGNSMKKFSAVALSLMFILGLAVVSATAQQASVNLRSNSSFAVLAGTTVTVTGGGTITGNVGIFPGTAYVAGTPPVTVNGTIYPGGSVAAQAQTDLTTAY